MKRFLFLILAFMQGCVAYAASPGTAAFNANQFSTNNNRISIKDSAVATNLVVHGELSSDSSATGSEFFGDGGSFGYRITPQTMSGFINFIPDTSAQTGVPYHTNTGTNVVETHLSLESFGYGIWTNNSGSIQATGSAGGADPNFLITGSTSSKLLLAKSGTTTVMDLRSSGSLGLYGEGLYEEDQSDPNDFAYYEIGFVQGFLDNRLLYQMNPSTTPISSFPIPFYYNTFTNFTSGNLFAVANNGTNKFVVAFDGSTTGTDSTINNLTINTNVTVNNNITVKGNAVLNVVSALSQTVSNNLTVLGTSALNTFTAESGTVSNNLTVLGNYVGTIDPAQTGTTLKQIKSLKLQFPVAIDNAGCTYPNTNDFTVFPPTFMVARFSGTGATNANFAWFTFLVPDDWDTAGAVTARISDRLTGSDTSARTYTAGIADIASGASESGTPANYGTITMSADGSGSSGKVEISSNTTMTGWAAAATPGHWAIVKLQRDGTDASTIASDFRELTIYYPSTQ